MITSRTGNGWSDVVIKGQAVGFVVAPEKPGHAWNDYLDYQGKAGHTHVASGASKGDVVRQVQNAWLLRYGGGRPM